MSKNIDLDDAKEKVEAIQLETKNLLNAVDIENEIKIIAETAEITLTESTSVLLKKFISELPCRHKIQKEKYYKHDLIALREDLTIIESELQKKHTTSDELRRSNRAILYALRSALNNSCYQIRKTDETNQLVRFLHTLCFAQYSDTAVSANFSLFGKKIKQVTYTSPELPLVKAIPRVWKTLNEIGIASNVEESSVNFSWKELCNYAYSYSSYIVTAHTGLKGYSPVDERVLHDNIPGALYDEELEFTLKNGVGQSCKARAVYTCSPTVGMDVSSEFRAVLQAMENRHFVSLDNDPYQFSFWAYVNLQDLANAFEHPQAIALMQLNEEFPLSFRGITVAQNSDFYRDESADHVDAKLDEAYRDAFLRELQHDDNFTLVNRLKATGGSYFFPACEKERWNTALGAIVYVSYDLVDINRQDLSAKDLRSAFRELVHLGIMRFHQKLNLENISSRTHKVAFQFFDSRVCKSCIDRGGKNTIAAFHVLSQEMESDNLTIGALFGRPLLVARRLIFENCANQLTSLIKVLPHAILQQYAITVGEKISSDTSTLSSRKVTVVK